MDKHFIQLEMIIYLHNLLVFFQLNFSNNLQKILPIRLIPTQHFIWSIYYLGT